MSSVGDFLLRRLDARTLRGTEPGPYRLRTDRDLRVPMDDGVELLADLIRPVRPPGRTDLPDPADLPTIVIRGPYGRRGVTAPDGRILAYHGFTTVFVSCRGTHGSGGEFRPQLDEEHDGLATHRWVRRQPWFTGRLATVGGSYLGFTQWAAQAALERADPAAAPEACVLFITMPDFGTSIWDTGAFALRSSLHWARLMELQKDGGPGALRLLLPSPRLNRAFGVVPVTDADAAAIGRHVPWFQDWLRHDQLTDEYWAGQSHTADVPDVTAAVFMGTGWYDIFLPWQLRSYAQLVAAGRPPQLTVGPAGHAVTGRLWAEAIEFLKDRFEVAPTKRAAPVRVFRTGANTWHDAPSWPPPGTVDRTWFLHDGGGLAVQAPAGGRTRFRYDPADPTPANGGTALGLPPGPMDNRDQERRADIAVFRSAPLPARVDVAGEPVAHVRFRSSAPSFDVFVRLTDVHPDGPAMTVGDGMRRVRPADAAATDVEGFTVVRVPLWPTCHSFAPGHRIGLQVSSGAHPIYARNPGSGAVVFGPAEMVVAQQEISHEGPTASRIDLPVTEW